MRLITEVARGLNGPARTSVMAGIGGGFTGEFLKSPRLTYSEILGPKRTLISYPAILRPRGHRKSQMKNRQS